MQDDPEVAARLARYELAFRMQARGPGLVDELGYDVAENPVSVHNLHATLLHLLGIGHPSRESR